MLKFALHYHGPIAIRYPRGTAYTGPQEYREKIQWGDAEVIYQEKEIALFAYGSMVKTAEVVREQLKQAGFSCSLINARFAKPLDEEFLKQAASGQELLVTLEENTLAGGFGSAVASYLTTLPEESSRCRLMLLGIPDAYVPHGAPNLLKQSLGLDAEHVAARIAASWKERHE